MARRGDWESMKTLLRVGGKAQDDAHAALHSGGVKVVLKSSTTPDRNSANMQRKSGSN